MLLVQNETLKVARTVWLLIGIFIISRLYTFRHNKALLNNNT